MTNSVEWLKQNKLVAILVAFILWQFLGNRNSPIPLGRNFLAKSQPEMAVSTMGAPMAKMDMAAGFSRSPILPPIEPEVPPSDTDDRLVIKDTNLSMVVNNVGDTIDQIESLATSFGGYLVNSGLNVPEGASSGSITIRVLADKRSQALEEIKRLGVRTINENVSGRDVTDEFVDIDARLDVLRKTKIKFESILDQAVEIQDLLQVQRELVSLQAQIDSLKGRQKYLEQSAKLTKITAFLSTDELALPYTPDDVWRPQVVFKTAIRSLISSLRSGADTLIWAGVFSVIWVPLLFVAYVVYRVKLRRQSM